MGEYVRRGRPGDGLSVAQICLLCKAVEGGQECYDLVLDENQWHLMNGEDDCGLPLPDLKAGAEYMLVMEPETGRCMIRQKGLKRQRTGPLYADTILRPMLSEAELNRNYLKSRPLFQSVLPPNYDDLRLKD